MKLLIKNTFKKIFKSMGKFLSITFIIALGISVFMGLRESTAGMLYTADNYYDEYNLMDFKISSTHGFTKDDVLSLKKLNNVENVIESYSLDVISDGNSIRVHALEKLNNVVLIKGKMPSNNNECVADYYKYEIGDVINFEVKNLNDFLSISSCKVVGTIKSPLYIRDEKGISNVGDGRLTSFVFVNKSVFVSEYYTVVYITSKDSKDANSYYDDYNKSIEPLMKELKELKPIRETIRYEEILKNANEKIISAKKKLDNEISKAFNKLAIAKNDLDSGTSALEKTKTEKLSEINKTRDELLSNRKLIINSLGKIKESELNSVISNLNNELSNMKVMLSSLEKNSEQYVILSATIVELETNYNGLVEVKKNLSLIDNGLVELEDGYELFMSSIKVEEDKLKTGYFEYEKNLLKVKNEEKEKNLEIDDARSEVANIKKPVWYLLDRTDNSGYGAYKDDIVKVGAISKVLPVFFILIVLLMTSNTLTRMVEEERNEMGILLSNGFSRTNIVFSYLLYVFIAGFFGLLFGMTIGYSLIPQIIYSVFLARYYVPKLITIVSPLPFSLVIVVIMFIMGIVTVIAVMKELKDMPASLLRVKPPKTGKKMIFEGNVVWDKLNFLSKTTIRNLFRYKKRIIMTVLGVLGCTALLLAGIGINDSINTISKKQYSEIVKYDAMYILDEKVDAIDDSLFEFFSENEVVNPLLVHQSAYTFAFDNKTEDVNLIVPNDILNFNNYINLVSVITDKKVSVPKNGVIITKQMADFLGASKGDSISIRNSDNELFILYVSDVVYNYVSHYIYLSESYYSEVFDENLYFNSVYANGKIVGDVDFKEHNIMTVIYTSDIIKSFNSFIKGLNNIIIMIVVFAAFLGFVVLYNLTIINVSERKREIATFKVLGFYDREIAIYVYRETLILTIIGIIFGLFFGIYLHRFIIGTAETDNIMFLRKINVLSYVITGFITIVFSVVVQLVINKTLKKIDMIDSLKSVE